MAGRRGGSHSAGDLVTIIYPPGCREVTEDLGSDELIRRLKSLAHTFQVLGQAEDETTYADYTPLAIHLADDHYLNHTSRDVQLLVACCIADILRIFAPEAPYKDPNQIKTIFYFLIKQLGGLKDPKDPAFKRYFYLLENLAYVKSFNMCFDLEDCNEIFCALFSLLFKIVNDEHSGKVKTFMLDVLCPLITEADFVSDELLDIILINIVDPYKTQRKNAASLAKDLVAKTSDTLEPYIQQFFNQVLILGKVDAKLSIARKVYDLIYELNLISPRILLAVLPQLEFKLKSTEESERMGSVSLLARMFSEKGSDLARKHRALWLAFLGRYNDISVAIRTKCVQYTMHFLLNHPELTDDICDTLKARKHDSEESVRYEVVMAIVSTARKDFDVVSQSEQLLDFVKERTLDKKFKIRKEAVTGLALIYKKHLSDPQNQPDATKKAVKWIKDKILHGYYMTGIEDRLLVERLLNTCLVPFNLESEERMKKLFFLFASTDENASKAFIEIQKSQLNVRKAVSELVAVHREQKTKDLQVKIHVVSKFLPEPVKAQEFLKKFCAHMQADQNMFNALDKVVNDPDISCKDCTSTVNSILKKLGAPIMTNLYYGTVKQLLERISSVMIDREAIQHLVRHVKDALNYGPILGELGLDPHSAGERGLRLLLVLAFVFPAHFLYQDILKELMSLLGNEGENVAPLVLSILTFIGKKKPIGEGFPDLLQHLIPVCKAFIRGGTPKQAKHSVKCLYINTPTTEEAVFADVLELVKTNLSMGPEARGDAYRTAIVALGHIAFHLPKMFPIHIKNLVSRKIVKDLVMQDTSEAREDTGEDWVDFDELPLDTQCKIEGLKMMARWLTGLQNDDISAQKTFRMLSAIISSKGDLLEEGKPSTAERAWLRLAAGCAMLKVCEQKGVGDQYTVDQFYNLSQLVTDPVRQVRERFITKTHKGLGRGIPYKCLPLDFMGFYSLVGLETDKKVRDMTKHYILADIAKRRDCIKSLTFTAGEQMSDQLPNIMPDYMLVFAVTVLTHSPVYVSHEDVDMLTKMRAALWYILEPLMVKNDSYSFGFYKALIDKMKSHVDALNGIDDATNCKMWALCDLALSLVMSKTTNFELKEFPTKPTIPALYFHPHPEGENFVNGTNYIPNEMVFQQSKKGISYVNVVAQKQPKKKFQEIPVVVEMEAVADDPSADEEAGPSTTRTNSESDKEDEEAATRKRGRGAAGDDDSSEESDAKKTHVSESEGSQSQSDQNKGRRSARNTKTSHENGTTPDTSQEEATSGRPKRSTRK